MKRLGRAAAAGVVAAWVVGTVITALADRKTELVIAYVLRYLVLVLLLVGAVGFIVYVIRLRR